MEGWIYHRARIVLPALEGAQWHAWCRDNHRSHYVSSLIDLYFIHLSGKKVTSTSDMSKGEPRGTLNSTIRQFRHQGGTGVSATMGSSWFWQGSWLPVNNTELETNGRRPHHGLHMSTYQS
eukprot:350318-Chlamydomonas_euryale.AAC.9